MEVKDDAVYGKDTDPKKLEFDQSVSNGSTEDKGERATEVEVESFGHKARRRGDGRVALGDPDSDRGNSMGQRPNNWAVEVLQ